MALGAMPTRPALLIRLADTDGCFGWGEVWANFPPRANLHKADILEDVIAPRLRGFAFVEPREVCTFLREALTVYFIHIGQRRVFEHLLAGIDTALWDLCLRKAGKSFAEFMRFSAASAATYASSINASDLDSLIPHHARLGQTHFKLKIGFHEEGDRETIDRANALRPIGTHLMIDGNQSWRLRQAVELLRSLEDVAPLFAEEPLRADAPLGEWETLAKATGISLAGGENVYGIAAFLALADAGMRFLQPDVAKWGGVTGALDLGAALPAGVRLWPHFMGTAVGQMAALSVSAAIGEDSVCEMDVNANRLRTELCGDASDIVEGRVRLPAEPGLVVPPSAEQLAAFADAGRPSPNASSGHVERVGAHGARGRGPARRPRPPG